MDLLKISIDEDEKIMSVQMTLPLNEYGMRLYQIFIDSMAKSLYSLMLSSRASETEEVKREMEHEGGK